MTDLDRKLTKRKGKAPYDPTHADQFSTIRTLLEELCSPGMSQISPGLCKLMLQMISSIQEDLKVSLFKNKLLAEQRDALQDHNSTLIIDLAQANEAMADLRGLPEQALEGEVMDINLYSGMNDLIADILRSGDEPADLYAAAYIDHLRAEVAQLTKQALGQEEHRGE